MSNKPLLEKEKDIGIPDEGDGNQGPESDVPFVFNTKGLTSEEAKKEA